ncbi:MAG: hypothetical protein AAF367_12995 [Pseudomonadota bacterium]
MAEWLKANPEEAGQQTGFTGGIADALAALDKRSFAAEGEISLMKLNSRWVAGLGNLTVVDDDVMAQTLGEIAHRNPHRKARLAILAVAGLSGHLSEPLRLGLGIAGWRATPPRPVTAIGTGSYMDIGDEKEMTWSLSLATGDRGYGVVDDTGARLYECVEGTKGPDINDREAMMAFDFASYEGPNIGDLRGEVGNADIAEAGQLCKKLKVGAAVHLLAENFDAGEKITSISVRLAEKEDKGQSRVILFAVIDRQNGY